MLKLQKADYQYDTKKKKHSMSKKKFNRKKNLQVNGNPAAQPLLFWVTDSNHNVTTLFFE